MMGSGLEDVLRVLAAFVMGAVVGAEREWRQHPGGLRSSALVAAAACAFARVMLAVGGNNLNAGIGALATGIGFLGAGVILHQGATVRGLSMAATFWAVAAIGVAVGVGLNGLALALTLMVFVAHLLLRPLSRWIDQHAPPADDGPR